MIQFFFVNFFVILFSFPIYICIFDALCRIDDHFMVLAFDINDLIDRNPVHSVFGIQYDMFSATAFDLIKTSAELF